MAVSGRTGIFTGKVDPKTDSLHAIENEHAKIHGGRHFFCFLKDKYGANDTNRDETNFIIIPPTVNSGYKCHMTFRISYYGAFEFYLEEDVTYTGGFSRTIYNNDRNSANTPLTAIKQDVTVTGGTRTNLIEAYGGDYANGVFTSGKFHVVRPDQEIILNGNYNYLLRCITYYFGEVLSGDQTTTTQFQFYEHVNIE